MKFSDFTSWFYTEESRPHTNVHNPIFSGSSADGGDTPALPTGAADDSADLNEALCLVEPDWIVVSQSAPIDERVDSVEAYHESVKKFHHTQTLRAAMYPLRYPLPAEPSGTEVRERRAWIGELASMGYMDLGLLCQEGISIRFFIKNNELFILLPGTDFYNPQSIAVNLEGSGGVQPGQDSLREVSVALNSKLDEILSQYPQINDFTLVSHSQGAATAAHTINTLASLASQRNQSGAPWKIDLVSYQGVGLSQDVVTSMSTHRAFLGENPSASLDIAQWQGRYDPISSLTPYDFRHIEHANVFTVTSNSAGHSTLPFEHTRGFYEPTNSLVEAEVNLLPKVTHSYSPPGVCPAPNATGYVGRVVDAVYDTQAFQSLRRTAVWGLRWMNARLVGNITTGLQRANNVMSIALHPGRAALNAVTPRVLTAAASALRSTQNMRALGPSSPQ